MLSAIYKINTEISEINNMIRFQGVQIQQRWDEITQLESDLESHRNRLLHIEAYHELHTNTIKKLEEERQMRNEEQQKTEINLNPSNAYNVKQ